MKKLGTTSLSGSGMTAMSRQRESGVIEDEDLTQSPPKCCLKESSVPSPVGVHSSIQQSRAEDEDQTSPPPAKRRLIQSAVCVESPDGVETQGSLPSSLQLARTGGCAKKKSKKCTERSEWSVQQKDSIRINLLPNVEKSKKPPTKNDVLLVLSKEPCLKERSWKSIKYQTWSMYQQNHSKKQKLTEKLLQ